MDQRNPSNVFGGMNAFAVAAAAYI